MTTLPSAPTDGHVPLTYVPFVASELAYAYSNFFLTCAEFLANFERLVLGCIEADFYK